MKRVAIFCLLLTLKMGAQDWVPLYNGNDIQGWEQLGDVEYAIEDGILTLKGGDGLLWCKVRELGNLTLRIVYSSAKNNEPGILLRIPEAPSEAWMAFSKNYQIRIDDKKVNKKSKKTKRTSKGRGKGDDGEEWDILEITMNGYQTIIKMNENLVAEYTDGKSVRLKKDKRAGGEVSMPEYGFLALQNLAKDDEIAIKEISYLDMVR